MVGTDVNTKQYEIVCKLLQHHIKLLQILQFTTCIKMTAT